MFENKEALETETMISKDSSDIPRKASPETFHPLYLQEGAIGYLSPVVFEDGMDWTECERFYTILADGTRQTRTHLHNRRIRRVRQPSKADLEQDVCFEPRSCLRKGKMSKGINRPTLRRCSSFNTLPTSVNLDYSKALGDELPPVGEPARVTFEEHIAIVTIRPIDDYPEEVQDALWMTQDEINRSARNAMIEEAERRLQEEFEQPVEACLERKPCKVDAEVLPPLVPHAPPVGVVSVR